VTHLRIAAKSLAPGKSYASGFRRNIDSIIPLPKKQASEQHGIQLPLPS